MIKRITLLIFIFSSAITFAQKNNTSPYSFFGIGEEASYKTAEEIQMGGIGVAFNSPTRLLFSNPASFASLRLTNYSLGLESKLLRISDETNSGSSSSSAVSYLALGFPIGQKAGFSFGLQPNTTVGYSLNQEELDGEDIVEVNLYSGDGGTNKVFAGFGLNLLKGFNVGMEGAYIFGNIENKLLNRREAMLATMHKTSSTLKGFNARIGFQYDTKLTEKLELKTGAVFDLESNLTNEGNEYLYTLLNTGSTYAESPRDTLYAKSYTTNINKPLRTTLGAGIGEENKWYAGLEYSFQDALGFEDGVLNNNTKITYDKSSRISFGGFYTPKFNSISSYWQRITYRAGVKFKETGLVVQNTSIKDFGMSFGVGLPIGQQLSNLNVGLELGTRGEKNNGLVKENYINFRLSLTLNDRWFQKRTLN